MTSRDRFLSGGGFHLPTAMTVAGSDSGGGAGIQADLKTFSAFGVFGTSAITAVTAQNTLGVSRYQALEPSLVAEQITMVLDDIGAGAIKTGMLANQEIIEAVSDALRSRGVTQLVVDPVMVSASGHRLLDEEAVEALIEQLIPLCLVLTPNIPEAEVLTGRTIRTLADMRAAAEQLAAMGCRYAVVKGGHLESAELPSGVELREIAPPVPLGYPWSPQWWQEDKEPEKALRASAGARQGRAEAGRAGGALCLEPAKEVRGRFAVDVVFDGRSFTFFKSPFFDTRSTHGTGCTFSAAIAAALALGYEPLEAIAEGKRFVTQAIQYAPALGRGHGPTNHLLRFAPSRPWKPGDPAAGRAPASEAGVRGAAGPKMPSGGAASEGERSEGAASNAG